MTYLNVKVFFLTIILFCGLVVKTTWAQNDILALQVDSFILAEMEQQNIPGLSASIVKEGQVVWKGVYGMANFETNTPVTFETKFTLASISKLFTATACSQLWEDGLLDIDADINNYLPVTILNPNFPEIPITTRQLLQHKSSLHDYESDLQLWDQLGDPMFDLEGFCTNYFIEDGSLYQVDNYGTSPPGESNYWYSNAGFTLLGYIVQEISGVPFNEYCQTNILDPLQMNTAGWFYSEVDILDLAMSYNSNNVPYGYYSVPEYPAAMLKANIDELSNFLIAFTQHGNFEGNEIISSPTFQTMLPEDMTNGFAWWGVDSWWGDSQGDFWSHGGYMNGVRTQLNYYPADSSGLIILTNGEGSYSAIQNKLEEYLPLFEMEDTSNSFDEYEMMDVMIYPNPVLSVERLYVVFGDNDLVEKQIIIHNTLGQLVFEKTTKKDEIVIDVSGLDAGMYTILLYEKSMLKVESLIIK